MSLSDKFHEILAGNESDPETHKIIAEMVFAADDSSERDGLLALMYHEGIGVPVDLDKCFEFAEKAAGNCDPLGYFMLGYLCDNIETPDQEHGGPRQKYDHYDAERFYELCARTDSRWSTPARLWLGDYYMDSARGGDAEIGIEYYESIADNNADAAAALSDHYWNLVMPEYFDDEEWTLPLFKWTKVAQELNPEEFSYRLAWLYADGIGCDKDPDNAVVFFSEAYDYGDWRGAKAIAIVYREFLDENKDISEEERAEFEKEISEWEERAEQMQKESAETDNENFREE